MNPCEINASVAAVATILAQQLTKDELAYWGIILSMISSAMTNIAALQDLCEDAKSDKDDDDDEINPGLIASAE